jgi:hypothetical protein
MNENAARLLTQGGVPEVVRLIDMQRQHSAADPPGQDRRTPRRTLRRRLELARAGYEAAYRAWRASPGPHTVRCRLDALMALAAAREAYCHEHQPI